MFLLVDYNEKNTRTFEMYFLGQIKDDLESAQFEQHHNVKSIIEILSFPQNILIPAQKILTKHSYSLNLVNYNCYSDFQTNFVQI